MAIAPTKGMEYLTQLCKVATKGNVTVEESWFTARLKFQCHKCFQTLTTNFPEASNEIDYQIQEFIKIHAHTGGHCAHQWKHFDDNSGKVCSKCQLFEPEKMQVGPGKFLDFKAGGVVPLTADFKKLKSEPSEQAIIQKKMAEYDLEILQKDNQIRALEIQAKSKAIELSKAGIAQLIEKGITAEELSDQIEAQQQEHAELIEAQKAQEQALQNILKLMALKDENQKLRGQVTGSHLPPPAKPKPLKISTGRKFR